MRAENRRPKVTAFRVPDPPDAELPPPFARQPAGALPSRKRTGAHLRLVPPQVLRADRSEREVALRLGVGFAAIVGFVGLGLWVEFGALGRATYLVTSLGLFSLYGAATWVPGRGSRAGHAGRGR